MYPLKQSIALTIPFFAHDVNGDGVTGITDGNFTKRISKSGGAFAAMTVTISEMENGWYSLTIGTTHSNTLGVLTVSLSAAACKRVNLQFRVFGKLVDDLNDIAQTDIVSDSTAFPGASITEARLSELAAANIPADIDTLLTRMSAANAQAITDWIDGGRLDLLIDAIKAKTDNLPGDPASETNVNANETKLDLIAGYIDTEITTIITHLTDIKGAGWTDENLTTIDGLIDTLATRLSAARAGYLDELNIGAETLANTGNAANFKATGYSTHDAAAVKTAIEAGGSHLTLIKAVTDALTAASAAKLAASAGTILEGIAETGTLSTTQMTTDLVFTDAEQLKGRIIIFKHDTATAGLRYQATDIEDAVVANGLLTFTAITSAPSDGDTFIIV